MHQVCRPDSRTWVHIPASHWAQSQPLSAKLTERGHALSKNLLQWKSPSLFNFPEMPLHLLLTHLRHPTYTQDWVALATPFLQTPHGCFPESSLWNQLTLHCITFVLPAFTLRTFVSIYFFHFLNFSINSSTYCAIKTRSSAKQMMTYTEDSLLQ